MAEPRRVAESVLARAREAFGGGQVSRDSADRPGSSTTKFLDLSTTSQMLLAVGSVVGAVSFADSLGLLYVADVVEVLDAQALISEGQAAAASVMESDNFIQLQLSLKDGTQHFVDLFIKPM